MEDFEILEMDKDEEKVLVANPNPDRYYEDTWGGVNYSFAPLKQFKVKRQFASILVSRAVQNHQNSFAQARAERQLWAQSISSVDQRTRDRASKYADKDGLPHTKPLRFPGLVDLSNESGKLIYEEGKGILAANPTMVVKTGDEIRKEREQAMKLDFEKFDDLIAEASKVKIDRPPEKASEWTAEQYVGYIERWGGPAVSDSIKSKIDMLQKVAQQTFEKKCKWCEEKQVMYKVE